MTRDKLKQLTFMGVANQIGQLGTCDRKQVGAVIVRDGRCISWGFNGAPHGLPHCDENQHGYLGDVEHWGQDLPWVLDKHGCRNATHAEANALAFAARQGISTDEATLFVGVSPCENCARLIIAAGIVAVYYDEEYRKEDGCHLLRTAGLLVQQLS